MTAKPTEDDRAKAEAALRPFGPHARMSHEGREQAERVAQAIADARAEGWSGGYTAGLHGGRMGALLEEER